MREILFRAQRLDNEDFVYGELLSNGSSGTYRIVENFALVCNPVNHKGTDLIGCSGEFIQIDPKTIGQFTGLTDKNGANIFDNHALICNDVEYKIVKHESGAYELYEKNEDPNESDPYFLFKQNKIVEIIED